MRIGKVLLYWIPLSLGVAPSFAQMTGGTDRYTAVRIDRPNPSALWYLPCSINNAGQVVGTYGLYGSDRTRLFLWSRNEGSKELPLVPEGGFQSELTLSQCQVHINDAGQILVRSTDLRRPVLLDPPYDNYFALELPPPLIAPGPNEGDPPQVVPFDGLIAEAINSFGQVVGWAYSAQGYWRAFVWDVRNGTRTLGTFTPYSMPGYKMGSGFTGSSYALGISDSGTIFGFAYEEYWSRPFRWAGGPTNEFGVLTGLQPFPFQPSNPIFGGKTVASDAIMMAQQPSFYTLLYNNGLVETLPSLPGDAPPMYVDLNKKGEVCGNSGSGPILYLGGVISNLNQLVTLTYPLIQAWALNDNGWIAVRGSDYMYVLIPKRACDPNTTPCISGPVEGSHPRSRFVVLNGTGQAGASIDLLSDSDFMGSATVDSDGQWEAVIEPGSGQHGLSARYPGAQDTSNTVAVTMDYHSPPTSLTDSTPFLSLRKADILVTSSPESPQKKWYGPNWTHVALYLGGDPDGTPMIAEAVTSGESFGLSQVRALPLDVSTVYQIYPTMVLVYRPIAELSRSQRDSIVSWAQGTAARGLQYWNVPTDFLPIGGAWVLWQGGIRVSPRFDLFMAAVRSNTWSTNKFICSTLVWRAYLEGTGGALNFLEGNLMSAAPGSYLQPMTDPAFLTRLGQNFLVPETFVRSGKLRPVW